MSPPSPPGGKIQMKHYIYFPIIYFNLFLLNLLLIYKSIFSSIGVFYVTAQVLPDWIPLEYTTKPS
jgi:hypothetical protein